MTMIDNYLSHLRSYLPENLREEISEELAASIYDRVEDQQQTLGRELNQAELESVLRELGHPMRVAASYLPGQFLVSSAQFPAYKMLLSMAFTLVALLSLLLAIPSLFTSQHLLRSTFQLFGQLADNGLTLFAAITLGFYLIERFNINVDFLYAWSPRELTYRSTRLKLNRVESFFQLVVYLIFLAWWNNLLVWPWHHEEYRVTFSSEWLQVYWPVNVIVCLSALVKTHQLIVGGWRKLTLATDTALALATIAIIVQVGGFNHFVVISDATTEVSMPALRSMIDNTIYIALAVDLLINVWEIVQNFRRFNR